MMSDGPTPPKGVAKVEQTQQTLAEKDAIAEENGKAPSDQPVTDVEAKGSVEEQLQRIYSLLVKEDRPREPKRKTLWSMEEDVYKLDEKKKGLVAIINNFTDEEKDGKRFRRGTENDEKRIRQFFGQEALKDSYELHPSEFSNLDRTEFYEALDELVDALKKGESKYHSFFLFIMSHGSGKGIEAYSSDEKRRYIPIDAITYEFTGCLIGAPKVIVIQACRGEEVDYGPVPATTEHDGNGSGGGNGSKEVEKDVSEPDETVPEHAIPVAADMLIALATVKDYVSYRSYKYFYGGWGSWFISNFIEQLNLAYSQEYYSSDIVEILSVVLCKVAKLEKDPKKGMQMPCFESTLRKKFYLLPPVLPQ